MKPLPAQNSLTIRASDSVIPSIPSLLNIPSGSYSLANRRVTTCSVQRVYPWLLFTSTAIAALFCFMYITKPVIMASQGPLPNIPENRITPEKVAAVTASAKSASFLPDHDRLPGEKASQLPASIPAREMGGPSHPATTADSPFEQTNLRIQHILTAEAPGGHLAKIDLEVPVLYQSGNIRWTPAEVAEARGLLSRLSDYQEKSRMLREEGDGLLAAWNHLIERSIPANALRADSPSLPTNQQDAANAPRPAGLNTTESIKIQPAGK